MIGFAVSIARMVVGPDRIGAEAVGRLKRGPHFVRRRKKRRMSKMRFGGKPVRVIFF